MTGFKTPQPSQSLSQRSINHRDLSVYWDLYAINWCQNFRELSYHWSGRAAFSCDCLFLSSWGNNLGSHVSPIKSKIGFQMIFFLFIRHLAIFRLKKNLARFFKDLHTCNFTEILLIYKCINCIIYVMVTKIVG